MSEVQAKESTGVYRPGVITIFTGDADSRKELHKELMETGSMFGGALSMSLRTALGAVLLEPMAHGADPWECIVLDFMTGEGVRETVKTFCIDINTTLYSTSEYPRIFGCLLNMARSDCAVAVFAPSYELESTTALGIYLATRPEYKIIKLKSKFGWMVDE